MRILQKSLQRIGQEDFTRSFQLVVDEKNFNLLWRALHDRENAMLANLVKEEEDSDNGALLT
jgi:hypothetical protein